MEKHTTDEDVVDLQFALAAAEEAAQRAEDADCYALAAKHRARVRELKAQLAEAVS